MKRSLQLCIGLLLMLTLQAQADFASNFEQTHDRIWIGADYWANPMEDWQIKDGRLECVRGGQNRNVHLLTCWLGDKGDTLKMSVRLGLLTKGRKKGTAGFLIGVLDPSTKEHRASLLHGTGISAGITSDGKLFLGRMPGPNAKPITDKVDDVQLQITTTKTNNTFTLTLTALDPKTKKELGRVAMKNVAGERLVGNLALVCNPAANRRPHVNGEGNLARFWFRDWKVSGDKVIEDKTEQFGPILYAMHTLSRGVMKMTAQMPPVGAKDSQTVRLQIQKAGKWADIGEQKMDPLSRTATFRIEKWNDKADVPYRLAYVETNREGKKNEVYFTGTVRKDPVGKKEISIAGFTGNTDAGFPNTQLVGNVKVMNPDVLFFSGDQIYESVGGYGIFRGPVPLASVNYLRKIYLWGYAFRDLMKDRPTLALPDDHDVYQGNIWGQNGRDCKGMVNHAKGGYAMPAKWVNVIQRTQTAHHPDPFDATPIEQGITVYYGDMIYGRISFAVLEDRKFKSGPEGKVNTWKGRPDHIKNPKFDTSKVDKPGLKLLGDRQLKFLDKWTTDWKGTDMKLAVSQTIFCNLANYHGQKQEFIIADLDSNGWPQTARNRALEALRRGFAFHYAGDQHLPSIVHHGIETWGDAGYSFCVPSIAAGYPRSWRPDAEGRPVRNRPKGGLENTGDYRDGLGNHVTVHGVGNPAKKNRPDRLDKLHDKASGFGMVRMNKEKGTITMECYRLQIDPKNLKKDDQFPGWPRTIHFTENYGRKAVAHLPELQVTGMNNPVVQVINEKTKEIVYTLRIRGTTFRPKVFDKEVTYQVNVSDPDVGKTKVLKGIKPAVKEASLKVDFSS